MNDQDQDISLHGQVALITGASRGIGAAVAKEYARLGAHVLLLARTIGALEELDDQIQSEGGKSTLIPQDLNDLDALDTLGPAIMEKFGQLDILVANAGLLGTLGPIAHAKAIEWNKVMNVNVNANFRLIRTLDPLLQRSPSGRAIFVTSGMADLCHAYWGEYATAKAALTAMVKTYAAENTKTSVRINLISPGPVDTKMLNEAFPGGFEGALKRPEDTLPYFTNLVAPDCQDHGEIIEIPDHVGSQAA